MYQTNLGGNIVVGVVAFVVVVVVEKQTWNEMCENGLYGCYYYCWLRLAFINAQHRTENRKEHQSSKQIRRGPLMENKNVGGIGNTSSSSHSIIIMEWASAHRTGGTSICEYAERESGSDAHAERMLCVQFDSFLSALTDSGCMHHNIAVDRLVLKLTQTWSGTGIWALSHWARSLITYTHCVCITFGFGVYIRIDIFCLVSVERARVLTAL